MPNIKLRFFVLLLFALFASFTFQGQLIINEVAAHKEGPDVEGNATDWIELYNASEDPINLGEYFLSDNPSSPFKWALPDEQLDAGDRIVILASGKNRDYRVRHWETMLYGDEIWKYLLPDSEPDASWNDLEQNIPDWLTGQGGIGYGDDDDNTIIANTMTLYMRQEFLIADTSEFAGLVFHADYDDAFVAYLNGVEIARSWNILGNPPAFNTPLEGLQEAFLYQGLAPEQHYLPKKAYQDYIEPGLNVLAVQVHNDNEFSSDLSSNFTLSVGSIDDEYTYGVVPQWFWMPESYYHTNFKISPGESIVLTNSDGVTIDQLNVHPDLSFTQSMGHTPDGTGDVCVFTAPTFDQSNNNSWCFDGIETKPAATVESGFYTWMQTVGISEISPGTTVRYTTNGDEPTESSPMWSGDIQIPTTSVLSLKAFGSGNTLPSAVADYTYLIDEDNTDLSVISLITDSLHLWDWNTGIYVPGPNAGFWYPFFGSNFWEPWSRWSRLEYFDPDGIKRAETTLDLEIHGGWSRAEDQRSFRFDMKSIYDGPLDWPVIDDKPYISAFNNLNIRNGGQHVTGSKIQDAFINRLMRDTYIDYCAYEPVILYVNGDFFGLYGIREKIDENYIENNYLINSNEVDLMNSWSVLAGSGAHFASSVETLLNADAQDEGFYDLANSMFDLQNYVDYFVVETYGQNLDWMGIGWGVNNVKLWRPQTPDGRWRYVLYDTDACFGYFGPSPFENYIFNALNPQSPSDHSDLFGQFLLNPKFRHYFINRYADLINTIFQPDHFDDLLYSMRSDIAEIMPDQISQWTLPENLTTWNNSVNGISNHNDQRVNAARDHINDQFGLFGTEIVELDVIPNGAGRIKISTITPEDYPWTGTYFNGCPVQITAIPNPGYEFSHWEPNAIWGNDNPEVSVTENLTQFTQFEAVFEGSSVDAEIQVSEINYHSHPSQDSGDWIELHNPSAVDVNISDWSFSNEYTPLKFDFPLGTVIPANGYLVLVGDEDKFTSMFPDVSNYMAELEFSVDNGGEYFVMKNQFGEIVLDFTIDDNTPWPQGADGWGRTLEKSNNTSYSQPEGWFDGCMLGSPGEGFSPCNEAIIVSEIHYNPAAEIESGDWFEILNMTSETIDLSAWMVGDENPNNEYILPQGTTIQPGERLVIAESPALFDEVYSCYGLVPALGPLEFGLSNNGETIHLSNSSAELVFSAYYDDDQGWVQEPDGDGPSLELDNPALPPNSDNWFAGCDQGSPQNAYDPDCTSGINVSIFQDGNTLDALAMGGNGNYTYLWYLDGIFIGEGQQIDIDAAGEYEVVAVDDNGCQGVSSVEQIDLGVDVLTNSQIVVHPNPAIDLAKVQLRTATTGRAVLVDLQGKVVWTRSLAGHINFDIPRESIASGTYYLKISSHEQYAVAKIIFD